MSARGIRRKKSTLTELKIAVVGAPSVGKSGMFLSYDCGQIILTQRKGKNLTNRDLQ